MRRRKRRLGAVLFAVLWSLCACTAETTPSVATPSPQPVASEAPEETPAAEPLLSRMTLRQKVGQLFMVRPDALDFSLPQTKIDDDKAEGVQSLTEEMRHTLEEYPVGGICQFGKNIRDAQQITDFNVALQQASEIPLLISVDEEGGRVARLANQPVFDLPQYESALSVGNTGNDAAALEMGQTIGAYLKLYGFNMDFAPVADVWTNPDNTVIGARAFSKEPEVAAEMARAMAQGLQSQGILPTFKHFPGHGDTAQDSHSGLAITEKTRTEMMRCEFLPFLPAEGQTPEAPRAIMVGHIAAPAMGTGDTPASLSKTMVTDLLRGELLAGEDALLVTDSLAMGAITEQYGPGEAAVQAFLAGNDLLLMPAGLEEAFDAVLGAVQDGTIPEERLEESVARILRFKEHYAGLNAAA